MSDQIVDYKKLYEEKCIECEELNNSLKIERRIHKHGDKILLRDLLFNETGYNMVKATDENMSCATKYANEAQKYQIEVNGNLFHNSYGSIRKRYNECGNDMEKRFKNPDIKGFSKSSGYPDLQTNDMYLEIKFAAQNNIYSTLRTFYISTLDKVEKNLPHILIGFIHIDGKLDNERPPKVIDLYNLEVTLKCEWESNNKEMYVNL
jgi:hypothetical protein